MVTLNSSHFSGWKDMSHSSAHFCKLLICSWRVLASTWFFILRWTIQSSANIRTWLLISFGKSLMNIVNSMGPSTDVGRQMLHLFHLTCCHSVLLPECDLTENCESSCLIYLLLRKDLIYAEVFDKALYQELFVYPVVWCRFALPCHVILLCHLYIGAVATHRILVFWIHVVHLLRFYWFQDDPLYLTKWYVLIFCILYTSKGLDDSYLD